jgi:hypothetical protein
MNVARVRGSDVDMPKDVFAKEMQDFVNYLNCRFRTVNRALRLPGYPGRDVEAAFKRMRAEYVCHELYCGTERELRLV